MRQERIYCIFLRNVTNWKRINYQNLRVKTYRKDTVVTHRIQFFTNYLSALFFLSTFLIKKTQIKKTISFSTDGYSFYLSKRVIRYVCHVLLIKITQVSHDSRYTWIHIMISGFHLRTRRMCRYRTKPIFSHHSKTHLSTCNCKLELLSFVIQSVKICR